VKLAEYLTTLYICLVNFAGFEAQVVALTLLILSERS